MRDLEIRGAGNLLGEAQSGHMEAVGYDLYCKMLNEAVAKLKGGEVEESFNTSVDLNIDAYIRNPILRMNTRNWMSTNGSLPSRQKKIWMI